jgi:hypothetical protein
MRFESSQRNWTRDHGTSARDGHGEHTAKGGDGS